MRVVQIKADARYSKLAKAQDKLEVGSGFIVLPVLAEVIEQDVIVWFKEGWGLFISEQKWEAVQEEEAYDELLLKAKKLWKVSLEETEQDERDELKDQWVEFLNSWD
jgi:hypothetical protein